MASSDVVVSPMSGFARVLVLVVAAVGFLFDTYELLMFPVIGRNALADVMGVADTDPAVVLWTGRLLWIAALCGGVFGLLGGRLIDLFGRKRIMVASILLYSFSPVAAAFSTTLTELVIFRCLTFIGVCVEAVAAVTWLAELFTEKRSKELAIGGTLAFASLGGILVTAVYQVILKEAANLPALPMLEAPTAQAAWRYTLLTGLVPGALILVMLPFVPESPVWRAKKLAGTLQRPQFRELFAPSLISTTIVTTLLSAAAYAAAFGALQLTPPQIAQALPEIAPLQKMSGDAKKAFDAKQKELEPLKEKRKATDLPADQAATLDAEIKIKEGEAKVLGGGAKESAKALREAVQARGGYLQLRQELGGLLGRILLAVLLAFIPSRWLLRLFLIPGIVLFPLTYLYLLKESAFLFSIGIFFCGLVTVAQFSFISEMLPKVFPLHLRGTGGSFATNVGGRMFGTMAALLNTELLSGMFEGTRPVQIAIAAAVIGGGVFFAGFILSFLLPKADEA